MHRTGRDALTEVHDILGGLRHFLKAVGTSVDLDTKAELADIERNLESLTNKISKHVNVPQTISIPPSIQRH